jgi:hypothetical protein
MSSMTQPADTISMSYVDTIMNSMGCLLMIFLLLAVIRGNSSLVDAEAADDEKHQPDQNTIEGGTDKPATKDPFVLLITAERSGSPLFGEDRKGAWNDLPETRLHTGPTFAILSAATPPSGAVVLRHVKTSSVRVRVIQGGKETVYIRKVLDNEVTLWQPGASEAGS